MCFPPQEHVPFEGESRYTTDFGPKRAEPADSVPMPPPVTPLPFDGQTSYNADYTAKRGEGPEMMAPIATKVCCKDVFVCVHVRDDGHYLPVEESTTRVDRRKRAPYGEGLGTCVRRSPGWAQPAAPG